MFLWHCLDISGSTTHKVLSLYCQKMLEYWGLMSSSTEIMFFLCETKFHDGSSIILQLCQTCISLRYILLKSEVRRIVFLCDVFIVAQFS